MGRFLCLLLFLFLSSVVGSQPDTTQNTADNIAINTVLDNFHQAASVANGEKYFGQLHSDAIFIGTDATERWDKEAFRLFSKPYFGNGGKGWTYIPRDRHINFSASGKVAWFDELLDHKKYGECRGTGVLELTNTGWKIQQYHLTFPLPNDLAADITKQIRQHKKGQ